MQRLPVCLALPVICAILLFCAPAGAQEFSLKLTRFALTDSASGLAAPQPATFNWKSTKDVGLTVEVNLAGQFKDVQKLKVFAVIKNEAGDVVFKSSQDYWVYPGAHVYEYKPALSLLDFFGTQHFSAELEINMKGFETIKQQLPFTATGPLAPMVNLDNLTLLDGSGHHKDVIGPRDPFSISARFKITSNELTAPLQLVLVADENPGAEPREFKEVSGGIGPNGNMVFNLIPGASGRWHITADGKAPDCFADWQNQYHPLRIYAILRAGKTVLAGESRFAAFYDPRPEQSRRGRTNDRRNCAVTSSGRWTSRQD